MMVALSYVAIHAVFCRRLWGRLFGIVAAIWGAGSLLGPLIGGVFADSDSGAGHSGSSPSQAALLAALALALLPAQPAARKPSRSGDIAFA